MVHQKCTVDQETMVMVLYTSSHRDLKRDDDDDDVLASVIDMHTGSVLSVTVQNRTTASERQCQVVCHFPMQPFERLRPMI